jgi:cephalosporin hydroxylase
VREIPGWLTEEVGAAMRNLIWKVKPSVCVEIGVFAGRSLINTALALKENDHGIVYGIDPWRLDVAIECSSPEEFDWTQVDLDAVHYDCMQAITQHDLHDYVIIIRAASWAAAHLFGWGRIDVLYIDGGHSEEQSTSDVDMYMPRVKSHGHIWMDDTNYESLKKALLLVEQDCTLVRDYGHSRLYRKN